VNRIVRHVIAAVALALPVGVATPASACALLEPGCVVGGVVDAVEEGTGGVGDTVDETAGTVEETADDVVAAVDDATGGAIGGLVGDAPPEVPDPDDPSPGDGPQGRDDPRPGDGRDDRRGTGATTRRESLAGAAAPGPRRSTGPSIDTVEADSVAPQAPPRLPVRLGPALAAALPSLAALAVLFALTLAFVAIQDRIDRRDPRLALAPTGPRVVPFR
jgi:hypothetical protein